MRQLFKKLTIAAAMMLSFSGLAVLSTASVYAADSAAKTAVCEGIAATGADGCSSSTGDSTVKDLIKRVINIFSWIAGIVSVFMVIFGGFKYITSGGDSAGITSAKNTILYAIIGLVVVALAQVIVRFVIGTVVQSDNFAHFVLNMV